MMADGWMDGAFLNSDEASKADAKSITYPMTCLPPSYTACETIPMRPMLPPPYTRSTPLATRINNNVPKSVSE